MLTLARVVQFENGRRSRRTRGGGSGRKPWLISEPAGAPSSRLAPWSSTSAWRGVGETAQSVADDGLAGIRPAHLTCEGFPALRLGAGTLVSDHASSVGPRGK